MRKKGNGLHTNKVLSLHTKTKLNKSKNGDTSLFLGSSFSESKKWVIKLDIMQSANLIAGSLPFSNWIRCLCH